MRINILKYQYTVVAQYRNMHDMEVFHIDVLFPITLQASIH